jgi:hypothetical protein
VRGALEQGGMQLRMLWGGSTLYHLDDLPFKLDAMPACYAEFKCVECGPPSPVCLLASRHLYEQHSERHA